MGDSDDIQIYHDGSNSYLQNATGSFVINADTYRINNAANNENIIKADANGAVELYHDNAKRLETQSGGIRVSSRLGVNCDPNGSHPMQVDHDQQYIICLLYTSPSPRDGLLYRMPSSA